MTVGAARYVMSSRCRKASLERTQHAIRNNARSVLLLHSLYAGDWQRLELGWLWIQFDLVEDAPDHGTTMYTV
jgi:hypothetical protein